VPSILGHPAETARRNEQLATLLHNIPADAPLLLVHPGADWRDDRDETARRRLPLYLLAGGSGREENLRRAAQAAGGALLACFTPGSAPWWRERLGADVAAWLREPDADSYADGIPHRSSGDLQELLRQTVPAVRLRKWLAARPADAQPPI